MNRLFKGKVNENESDTVNMEPNVYITRELYHKDYNQKFDFIKDNWMNPSLSLSHFKYIVTAFAFYKSLVLFITRYILPIFKGKDKR